jgi:hypothetical protein
MSGVQTFRSFYILHHGSFLHIYGLRIPPPCVTVDVMRGVEMFRSLYILHLESVLYMVLEFHHPSVTVDVMRNVQTFRSLHILHFSPISSCQL